MPWLSGLLTRWKSFLLAWKEWRAKRFRDSLEEGKILLNDQSFVLLNGKGESHAVTWNSVNLIRAFKRDLFSVDLICLEFQQDEGRVIEVDEHMAGYKDLIKVLSVHFKGIDQGWYLKVVQPAFELCLTEVWRRRKEGKDGINGITKLTEF